MNILLAVWIIILSEIVIEVYYDYWLDYKKDRDIHHGRGWVMRAIAALILLLIAGPLSLFAFAGIHGSVFDPIMGILIHRNPIYLGNTATTDKWLTKLSKYINPLSVFSLRLIIMPTIASLYFQPLVWLDFLYEIADLF